MKKQQPEDNAALIDLATRLGDGRLVGKVHNTNVYNVQDIGRTVNGGVKRDSLKGFNETTKGIEDLDTNEDETNE